MPHTFLLDARWALGDTVVLSALVRDLQLAYPGEYEILLTGNYQTFWNNNPYGRGTSNYGKGQRVKLECLPGIRAGNRGEHGHFLTWFHRDFENKTGIRVPVTQPKGDIHLTTAEQQKRLCDGPYWLIAAGGKLDMPVKVWHASKYQAVVDTLHDRGIRCVQVGATFRSHYNPRLKNCLSVVGKTDNIRDLFSLIYHCEGVICGITSLMHLAAVWDKPCVVIAGGRERESWEGYTNNGQWPAECAPVKVPHRYLSVIGQLDCCADRGCWKDRVVPLDKADLTNETRRKQLCSRPVKDPVQPVPECMEMISPAQAIEAVMSYRPASAQPYEINPARSVDVAVWAEKPPPEFQPPDEPEEMAVLDHPYLQGKITVFVLCFGDYYDLARRCIDSIVTSVPAARLDLRVGLNQVCAATRSYVQRGPATKIYEDKGDRRKYPAMREMFRDPAHPVKTSYVVWFDDDSYVLDKLWLPKLANTIVENHAQGCRLYGVRFYHNLALFRKNGHKPEEWFQQSTWWRQRGWTSSDGKLELPNGSHIPFVGGSIWAAATHLLRDADLPDRRLNHNGGDIAIGAQVYQTGYKIKDFSRGKTPVCWSAHPRRGHAEAFPWSGGPATG